MAFPKISLYLTPKQRARFQSPANAAERERLIQTGKLKRYLSVCLAIGQVFDASSNAMVIVDTTGEIVLVNSKAEELFQYERDELIGSNVGMLVPKRCAECHAQGVAEFMKKPRYLPIGAGHNLYGVRKDGREVPLDISLSPMKVQDDVFVAAIIVDITECKRAERMFKTAVEASPTAMMLVDAAMRIVLVNSKTEALFQFTRTELVGKNFSVVISGRSLAQTTLVMQQAMATTASKGPERTVYGLRKDGTELAIVIGLNMVDADKDDDRLLLVSIIDMSDRIKMENLIKSSQVALEASRLKSIFLANMSHEIRTPMSGISTFSVSYHRHDCIC